MNFHRLVIAKCLGRDLPQNKAVAETIPVRPPVMCCGCPHRGLFYELKKHKVYVSGDIGCYTLGASAPLSAMDTCVCMGASVSALHGYNKARGPERRAQERSGHRRFHVHPFRHHRPDRHRLQPDQFGGHRTR